MPFHYGKKGEFGWIACKQQGNFKGVSPEDVISDVGVFTKLLSDEACCKLCKAYFAIRVIKEITK